MANTDVLSPPQASAARSILRVLRAGDPTIEACALVTNDGRVAASVLDEGVNPDRVGAMGAALLALSTRAGAEVQRGELQQLILEGATGTMMLTRAGAKGLLIVAASRECTLGKLIRDARSSAAQLGALFPQ